MDDPPPAAGPKPCCICAEPGGKHCTKCKSRHYCGKACQLIDWHEGGHKAQCRQMAAVFQDRLLDELMPAKKVKEEPPIVEDVAPAAEGSKARLSAVSTVKPAVKATALSGETLDWRGTCAICLDVLPVDECQQAFYSCCCTSICKDCSAKCLQHDERCPLCRAPALTSTAEFLRRVQKHADKGNAEAQFVLGGEYFDGALGLKHNLKRAMQLFERAAAQGHAPAQFSLGRFYEFGHSVKIDHKTAALWYRRAAEQGFPQAQLNIGLVFYDGKGVAQSYEEAARWWRLAAAQGNPCALFNLGVCHEKGHGVPQDVNESLRFLKHAAAKGHAGAAAGVESIAAYLAATRPGPPT